MKSDINSKIKSSSEQRYNHFNSWLKDKFGERVLKICVDGGFTCPNRDGTKGTGGCIFCGERGSGEHLSPSSISNQVEKYLSSYKSERANKFIVYFQNFTNTYDSIKNLKLKYDSALISDKIVGLVVATRPDAISEDVAELLSDYSKNYFVWVELGFQTSNERTGEIINRKYSNKDVESAIKLLKKYNIPVVLHLMIGLPNESYGDLKNTIDFINLQNVWGVKIHSTYVIKNTKLHEMYLNGSYKPLELDDYVEKTCYTISHLNSDIVVHRITGDAPKDLLVAPEWNLHKKIVLNKINKYLSENNLYQGCEINKD